MKLYWKHCPEEVQWFEQFMDRYREVEFFQPAPEVAPWHVQARLDNGVLINFWPHVVKAMIENDPPVRKGIAAIDILMHEARTIVDFEVIEDG
jgi:hypothetical protein